MADGKIPQKRPTSRKVSARGLVHALAGREKPYNAYRFGATDKYEKPNHNPFKGL